MQEPEGDKVGPEDDEEKLGGEDGAGHTEL